MISANWVYTRPRGSLSFVYITLREMFIEKFNEVLILIDYYTLKIYKLSLNDGLANIRHWTMRSVYIVQLRSAAFIAFPSWRTSPKHDIKYFPVFKSLITTHTLPWRFLLRVKHNGSKTNCFVLKPTKRQAQSVFIWRSGRCTLLTYIYAGGCEEQK